MRLCDAHIHLQDPRLASWLDFGLTELAALGIGGAVVNGTHEADWDNVANLAARLTWVVPSYGLHPWQVGKRSDGWLRDLKHRIKADPAAAVGEVGLDRSILTPSTFPRHNPTSPSPPPMVDQTVVLRDQLALAAEENRAASIHCVRAWAEMKSILATSLLPSRGVLLHAYSGPTALVSALLDKGAYFSFNGYFLRPRFQERLKIFAALPSDRILVETDAPSLAPPDTLAGFRSVESTSGRTLNHPANLLPTVRELAALRRVSLPVLCEQLYVNFDRLFRPLGLRPSPTRPL